jgi:peroxiredoxin Q/BCP
LGGLTVKEKALSFCLPDQKGKTVCLEEFRRKWVVLYFYPKDNSKSCTLEAVSFTENMKEFEELGAIVIGVSPDSVKSHQNFVKLAS